MKNVSSNETLRYDMIFIPNKIFFGLNFIWKCHSIDGVILDLASPEGTSEETRPRITRNLD